jgi:DNA-binding response OmpR family regulator
LRPAARILVVDDSAISRKLLRVVLEAEGHAVAEAGDAEAAISAVKRDRYDMILQDLVLPDMHGFDLVTVLRALPNGAGVPIIAVSGFLSRIEEALATSNGFASLLVKPVEPACLLEAMRLFLPERSRNAA